jgi:glycosyltransferase involved in cell wall biosynthesis
VRLALDTPDPNLGQTPLDKLHIERLEMFKKGNFGGPGLARNLLLTNIKSDYVTFWDADDVPNVENLHLFLENFSEDKTRFIVGQWELRKSGQFISKSSDNNLASLAFQPGVWRVLFPSEKIENKMFINSKMGEDQVYLFGSGLFAEDPIWENSIFYAYNTGQEGQLTNNQDAIKDLELSISSLKNVISMRKSPPLYGQLLLLRMLTTYWLRVASANFFRKLRFTLKIFFSLRFKRHLPYSFGLFISFHNRRGFKK